MSNFGLYKAFDAQGIGYAKTAVGDKYVYEYMAKNGCRIGGEQSGHIIFSKYASTGDGILTSLKMMEVMLAKKKPMSELAAPLKIYPQVLEECPCHRQEGRTGRRRRAGGRQGRGRGPGRAPAVSWSVSPAPSRWFA